MCGPKIPSSGQDQQTAGAVLEPDFGMALQPWGEPRTRNLLQPEPVWVPMQAVQGMLACTCDDCKGIRRLPRLQSVCEEFERRGHR